MIVPTTSRPDHVRRSQRLRVAACSIGLLAVVTAACGNDTSSEESTTPTTEPAASVDLSDAEWTDRTDESETVIQSRDNSFTPGYIVVQAGTTITFRNVGRTQHNALPVDEGAFEGVEADQFQPQDEHTITLQEPGDYPYYCSLHGTTTKGMVGAIRVVE